MTAALHTALLRLAVADLSVAAARLERLGFMVEEMARDPGLGIFSQWLPLGTSILELASPQPGGTDEEEPLTRFLSGGPGLSAIDAHWMPFVGEDPGAVTARVRQGADGATEQLALRPLGAELWGDVTVSHLVNPVPLAPAHPHPNGITGLARVSLVADNPLGAATRLAAAAEIHEIAVGHEQAEIMLGDLRLHFASPILTARRYGHLDLGDRLFGAKVLSLVSGDMDLTGRVLGSAVHDSSLPGQWLLLNSAPELGIILEVVSL